MKSQAATSKLLFAALMLLGFSTYAHAMDPPILFEDASDRIDFEHLSLPFGGDGLAGAAWLDYNDDGFIDLFLTNGKTQKNGLFENDGDGTFTDVSNQAGIENGLGSSGALAADFDNDGWTDLFLTGDGGVVGTGNSAVTLYRNNGNGTFTDITMSSGILGSPTTLSAAAGDINNDGFLDLFIAASGSLATGLQDPNQLFLNNGDLTFTDIGASSGVDTDLGACIAFFSDYDDDGQIDLFVGDCNDVTLAPTPIELFRNNGDLTFTDVGPQAGLDPGGYWMGFGPADFDNDGDIDIFVSNLGGQIIAPHALYENAGDGTYTDIASAAGTASFPFGWGCSTQDFDNDGFADLFFVGALPPQFLSNSGVLLFNDGDRTFTDVSASLPVDFAGLYPSGVASADFDNDGFMDIVILREPLGPQSGQPVLLRNTANGNTSLTIRLVGTVSNRGAVGARVEVFAGELHQTKEVYAGSSFASTDSPWLTFGLGTQVMTDRIRVRWPSGIVDTFPNAGSGQTITLVEGEGVQPQFPVSDSKFLIRTTANPGGRRVSIRGKWSGGLSEANPIIDQSTLRVAGGPGEGNSGLISLVSTNWKALLRGRGFKYVDPMRTAGGIRRIVLRTNAQGVGRLRIKGGRDNWTYEISAPHTAVSFVLTAGAARWCTTIADPVNTSQRVKGKAAAAPPTCPPDPLGDVLRTPNDRFVDLPDYPFAPHYLQAGRLRMHYVDEGPATADPVLLLHGEPSWSYLYREMIPIITAAGYRAIAPDLIGFGKSDKPAEPSDYTYQNHVDWIRHLIQELNLQHVTLFAQDWGGLIGLRLVAEEIDRFDRVVAANTFLPTGDIPPSAVFLAFRDFMAATPTIPVGALLQAATVNALSAATVAAYDAPFPDESFKAGARIFPQLVPITPNDPASAPNRAAWEVLMTLQKPFLTAFSDSDPITVGGDLVFQALIPGAAGQSHTTVVNAGHFLQEDAGEELGQIVTDFIQATSP